MADPQGYVVFQKTVQASESDFEQPAEYDDEEDIWDDSALIKAYDKAISAAKKQIAVKIGLTKVETIDSKDGTSFSASNTGSIAAPSWKVGDHCRASYSVDGLDYEGTVKSLNPLLQTCVVHFTGYGNEEEVHLDSLTASYGAKARRKQEQEAGTYITDECMNNPVTTNDKQPRDQRQNNSKLHSTSASSPATNFPLTTSCMGHMPGPPPIPPPPPIWPANGSTDEDLYPMLMAWYMAGYHTGYYQGLHQQRSPPSRKH